MNAIKILAIGSTLMLASCKTCCPPQWFASSTIGSASVLASNQTTPTPGGAMQDQCESGATVAASYPETNTAIVAYNGSQTR